VQDILDVLPIETMLQRSFGLIIRSFANYTAPGGDASPTPGDKQQADKSTTRLRSPPSTITKQQFLR
jgi:hypothetical protein